MEHPQIVGWAHSKFGKAPEENLIDLIASVVPDALTHAGVEAADVDGIYVGVYNNGFSPQAFEGSLVGMAVPELAHVPAMHLENACATGSAALYAANKGVSSKTLAYWDAAQKDAAATPRVSPSAWAIACDLRHLFLDRSSA